MLTPLMSPDAVAEYLGKTTKTVHQLVREGKLDCIQITPKDRRFSEEQLKAYLDRCTVSRAKPVDKKPSEPLRSPRKGGVKSVEDFGTDLVKEMRSLCR